MNNVTQLQRRERIVVSLVESNFLTRWLCHVCGGRTEKVSILAEVTEGEYAGLRVCESCLQTRNFDAKLIASAEKCEQQAAELRELVGRLEVPTYVEWHQREFDHEIETMRYHKYTDEQIADHCIDAISDDCLEKEYAEPCIDWLIEYGMTREQIVSLASEKRAKNAAQARANQKFMEMHPDEITF